MTEKHPGIKKKYGYMTTLEIQSKKDFKTLLNIKEILKSEKLAEAFYKFDYPKEWSWKLKVQIWLIRHKMWNVLKKI